MPVLRNPKHEKFSQLLALGNTAVQAYEQAGYRRDDGNAARLAQKPAIAGRVQELTAEVATQTKFTAEMLIQRHDAIYRRGLQIDQLPAATNANKEISILTGHRIEKAQIGQPGEFDHLTDEELEREVRELLVQLGFICAKCPLGN